MTVASASASAGKLLVVDDVVENRALLNRFFSRRGFAITEAGNGADALDMIARERFDLVLLDVVMPEMDGIETVKRIRRVHSPSQLPVIMVTARTENSDVVAALDVGANDYLTKPVDFPVALARVKTQLARKQAEEALQSSIGQLEDANKLLQHEIAGRTASEARIRYMAQHDALTGLGNRFLFRDQLVRALGRLDERGRGVGLLFVDLDQFKPINDTLGHRVGDLLLAAVGDRLREAAHDHDAVARLGGDEFAVIHAGADNRTDAEGLARRIIETVTAPYFIEGNQLTLGCSVGITLAPEHGNDPDTLLSNADLALYRAKSDGRGTYRVFEPEMNARAVARRALELELRNGVQTGQFELHYQPLLDLHSGQIGGFEALARWRHPQRGLVAPGEFITAMEESGLIVQLGEWVVREACFEAVRWPEHMRFAINLSPVQFRDGNIVQTIVNALAGSGLAPKRLEIEITETALLHNNEETLATLHQLRKLGVRISMDDFGTGYSSLSYLRLFPFTKIKIDRSFVADLMSNTTSMAIVRAIISLAHSLGMSTTAEGLETQEQLDWFRDEGCTEGQGYLISRPMPACDAFALHATYDVAERKIA